MRTDHVVRSWPYDPAGLVAWIAGAMQIPILASLAWREAFCGAAQAERHDAADAEAGHALVVPPVIEQQGEHALFA